ncbi:MAG TPA: PDZ domain-containing protein [Verrucomicrobiae bacterium]|jgi:serine protease Do|nr:PDZ domain-containing protein [Verrucomicrobiae bacterium]
MKLALIILTAALAQAVLAQDEADYPALPRARYRSGQAVLDAFAPISALTSNSVVEFNVNGNPVALGAVVDTNGLTLTKASELSTGKLTCWLAAGAEVEAQLLAVDDDDDVALVRVKAEGLRPIQWTTDQIAEGQWAITPCLADTPVAVGIISTLTHRIRPQRALLGVWWDMGALRPTVLRLSHGYGAEKAGVAPGDVILAVDGKSVTNREQVVEILEDFRDGQSVRIRFQRAEREFQEDIKLMTPKAGQDEFDPYMEEQDDQLSGDVSLRSQGFDQAIEHDTVLEPWQCGGPLVNLDGKTIGLNIARASRVATYALPAALAREILAKLKAKAEKP